MAALAIFSMLSVLAFMIFSQASELHQRSQKEIQQFNQLQRTITIDNDLLQFSRLEESEYGQNHGVG